MEMQTGGSDGQKTPLSDKIDVTTWFSIKLKENKKLRSAHYAAIVAFFKNKNLGEHESKETFDKTLKDFGF